jgi:hypothetical protein
MRWRHRYIEESRESVGKDTATAFGEECRRQHILEETLMDDNDISLLSVQ